jgi:hypothetical protein
VQAAGGAAAAAAGGGRTSEPGGFDSDSRAPDPDPTSDPDSDPSGLRALQSGLLPALQWYSAFTTRVAEWLLPGCAKQLSGSAARRGDPSVLDAFLYPNAQAQAHLPAARVGMGAHYDPGFMTVTLVSKVAGLAVADGDGGGGGEVAWVEAEAEADAATEVLVFLCESLERLMQQRRAEEAQGGGAVGPPRAGVGVAGPAVGRAALHRVDKPAPGSGSEGAPRLSLVYELRSFYDGLEG